MKVLKLKISAIFLITTATSFYIVSSHGAHYYNISSQLEGYFLLRELILAKEYTFSIAGATELEGTEVTANEQLMKYALEESNSGVQRPGYFPPFYDRIPHYLAKVRKSPVFKILKAMPKGALLHTHDIGMASAEYIYSLTYRKNLYVCLDEENGNYKLKFFNNPDGTCPVGWLLFADKRKDELFDIYFREQMSMLKKIPFSDTKDIARTSKEVQEMLYGLLTYKPVFEDYIYQTLLELYEDGIRYYEFRYTLAFLYDLDENTYGPEVIFQICEDILVDFQIDHPNFYGFKIIYTFSRDLPEKQIIQHLRLYENLKHKFGDLLAGIDLSGGEDLGKPLKDLAHLLLPLQEAGKADFYFHAGVTNWLGIDADENILDALLLGSRRIGHGYALTKHPKLMQMVKERGVAVEVAPLSDRVLGLNVNIGNNPGAILGSLGVNLVITNGNPGLHGAEGVTYDWYLAFMGFSSAKDDLRYLKKMALNSIEYSGLSLTGKQALYEIWREEWDVFIEKLANGYLT